MKAVHYVLIASLVISNTAFAQNSELDRLAEASRSEVEATVSDEKKTTQELIDEVSDLRIQITNIRAVIGKTKTIRTISFVVSGTLAVATGLLARQVGKSDLGTLGFWLVGTGAAGAGSLYYGGKGAYKQYRLSVDSEKLSELEEALAKADGELKQRLKELEG